MIRNHRRKNRKSISSNKVLLSGFNLLLKLIVALLKQYRNVITARESRLKKRKEPINLENQVLAL